MARTTVSSRRVAWAVPAAVALAIGAMAVAPSMSVADTPDLPPLSAQELLTKTIEAKPEALSGTVEVTSNLGLPDLSDISAFQNSTAAGPLSLLTGTTKLSVWADPEVGSRANILGANSEYSVVASATDVWAYSSEERKATHVSIPADAHQKAQDKAKAQAGDLPTPAELSEKVLKDSEATTAISVDTTATVAGRDCYQVIATPKDSGSLVASVRIAIDAKTFQPLRAQVYSTADAAKPALESAFTSIDYGKPAASVFQFTPPQGTSVEEITPPAMSEHKHPEVADSDKPDVSVSGKGWASIVEVSNLEDLAKASGHNADPAVDAQSTEFGWFAYEPADGVDPMPSSDEASQILGQLTKQVDGGTVFQTNLFSVLLTDDGRVFAGAVPSSALQAAAS